MSLVKDAQDMEVTRQHIRDAQERLGQTEVLLEENQVQYDQYLENRKMKRACGGKKRGADLRAEKKILQKKIQVIQEEISKLEGQVQAMQGDGTNAADREGDGKTDMGSSGLVPEAGQVSLVAQPGVLPERTPDDTSMDPGGQPSGASPLSSTSLESSGPPTLTAGPADVEGQETVPVTPLPTTGFPNSDTNVAAPEDTSKTAHEEVTGHQTTVTITQSPARSPSANDPLTPSSVLTISDGPPTPAATPLNQVIEDEAGAAGSGVAFRSAQLTKDKGGTHLPRKRPAEDPDQMAGQNVKRGRGLPGTHATNKNPTQSRSIGRDVLPRLPKKKSDLQRGNRRISIAEMYKRQQKAKQLRKLLEGNAEPRDKIEETDGEEGEGDREEEGEADKGKEGEDEEQGVDGIEGEDDSVKEKSSLGDGESSIIDEPMIVDNQSKNNLVDPEDGDWSMKLHEATDVDDLQRSLVNNSTQKDKKTAGRPGGKESKPVAAKRPAASRRVAKQRAVTATQKAGKGREKRGTEEEEGVTKEGEVDPSEGRGSRGDCVDEKDEPEVTEGGTDDLEIPGTTPKYEPPRQRWDNLTKAERREDVVAAREAIRYFVAYPNAKDREIPSHLRVMIREVSEFCPEAAYISKELALHCLTSCFNNTACIYHWYHDKAGKINDTNPPRTHKITGVPWERDMNQKSRQEDVVLPAGSLHCGCAAEDALWDFLWWKTGRIYSPTLDMTEPWRTTRLDPRARGLMVEFMQRFTHMSLEDIYSGTIDYSDTQLHWWRIIEHKSHHYRKQLKQNVMQKAVDRKHKNKKPVVASPDPASD